VTKDTCSLAVKPITDRVGSALATVKPVTDRVVSVTQYSYDKVMMPHSTNLSWQIANRYSVC